MEVRDNVRIVLGKMKIEGDSDEPNYWADEWITDDEALKRYRDRHTDSMSLEEIGVFEVDLRAISVLELGSVYDTAMSIDEHLLRNDEQSFAGLLTALFRLGFMAGVQYATETD